MIEGGTPALAPASGPRWWPWLRRALTLAFFVLLGSLLFTRARSMDWRAVGLALEGYSAGSLILALLLAAASYAVYSSYDLFGRHYSGHRLSVPQVLSTAFVSYAFNLNMGALVGGIGFRYRLYSRYGLRPGQTTRVLAYSVLTNWIGYLPLAGLLFAGGAVELPPQWKLGNVALQVLGYALLATAALYVLACAFSPWRAGHLRGQRIELPTLRVALLQVLLSSANWLLIGTVMYVLLQQAVPFPTLLGVLLISSIAGVVAHVPAGLGVIEAVFLGLLGERFDESTLLAALLTYRAVYYLLPLLLALATYAAIEARLRPVTGPR